MRLAIALLATGLAIAACSPSGEGAGGPRMEPQLAGDLTLTGTEPFWGVQISEASQTVVFTRPDHEAVIGGAPKRVATAAGATFTAAAPGGELKLSFKKTKCSDGMSDRVYPFEAEAKWQGATYKGCAIPTADFNTAPPA